MTDLIPRARFRTPATEASPFLALHREMNRLFDDAFRDFSMTPFSAAETSLSWPSVEVSETDRAVTVSAELAGLDEKDLELRVEDNVLTIKGEKHMESEDKERKYSERFYGRFERRLALPEVDEQRAEATFKNGVLTVTLPKAARAKDATKRIPITSV